MTWLTDANGNKCSVEYFGSEEAARRALESLKECYNCTNCSHCSRCSRCWRCSGCSRCSRCSRCSYCSYCSRCSYCSDCSRCSGLKDVYGQAGQKAAVPLVPAVPVVEDLHKKLYAAVSQPAALSMANWHTCETTHCRAGWVVHLAGEPGKKLEQFFNTELAAMKIYAASGYKINPSRFYDSNEDALEDMRRLAEQV